MGVDFIGWRNCSLQSSLESDGFIAKLKLRAYKAAVESRVPEQQWPTVKVSVRTTGRGTRTLSYSEICSELETFNAGSPECRTCVLGERRLLGCYRYVTYPIDEAGETALYRFFVVQSAGRTPVAKRLNRYAAKLIDAADSPVSWTHSRGAQGKLAKLAAPLKDPAVRIDSAQLLHALFSPPGDGILDLDESVEFWTALGSSLAVCEQTPTVKELVNISALHAAVGSGLDDGWSLIIDG